MNLSLLSQWRSVKTVSSLSGLRGFDPKWCILYLMACYIYVYICFYSMIFLSFITMAIPLAVSVVLSILTVSVLRNHHLNQAVLTAYAQMPITNGHIDKLEIKHFVWAFIYICTVNA